MAKFSHFAINCTGWPSCGALYSTYLHPCAHVGSSFHQVNSKIMSAAALLAETLHGPVLVVGDWNAPATNFEPIVALCDHFGFADLAEVSAVREGVTPEPTCRGATRHAFAFGNVDVVRYLISGHS